MAGWESMTAAQREQHMRDLDAQMHPERQAPGMPTITNLMDSSGLLKDVYKLKGGPDVTSGYDRSALDALKGIGMAAPGESAWEKMMMQKQGLQEATSRDKGVRGADTQRLASMSQLASSGGMTNSARERLARGAGSDMMSAKQDIARQGALDRLGIGVQGEQNRLGVLQALPGMELGRSQLESNLGLANRDYSTNVNKANISSALTEVGRQDQAKQDTYARQMEAWAANQQANATANSGGGLSHICTETHKFMPFTDDEWAELSTLRKYFKITNPDVYKFYFQDHGSDIVHEMKKQGFDFRPLKGPIDAVIELVRNGEYEKAAHKYWVMTKVLCDIYATEIDFPEPKYLPEESGNIFMSKTFENEHINSL